MSVSETINYIKEFIDILKENDASVVLSLIGLALLAFTILAVYKGINTDPNNLPGWLKALIFTGLVGSIVFSAAGPAVSLIESPRIHKMETKESISRLKDNSRVTRLIRLIPYDPKTKEAESLALSKISHLGRPSQTYTFVADYDELRGHSVADAMRKIGVGLRQGQHVSAFIFNLPPGETLYPANARGVLQVIKKVEETIKSDDQSLQKYNVNGWFDRNGANKATTLLEDLENTQITTWSWGGYGESYKQYCQAVQEFRCEAKYYAHKHIGNISVDWHPIGYARHSTPVKMPCSNDEKVRLCEVKDWSKVEAEINSDFGARVFLIRNQRIENIEGRYMIEFTRPESQIIPVVNHFEK